MPGFPVEPGFPVDGHSLWEKGALHAKIEIEIYSRGQKKVPIGPDFLATNRKIVSRVRRLFNDFVSTNALHKSPAAEPTFKPVVYSFKKWLAA